MDRRAASSGSDGGRVLHRWTEAVGIIGVIASLVFVGVEIRQNTQAVRGATYQSLTESSMSLLFRIADDPEVGVQLGAWGAGEELDPVTRQKVNALVLAYLRHLENAYYQMEEGTLRPEFLENWAGNPTFGTPHFSVFWEQRRASFGRDFASYFEDRWNLR